MEQDAKQYLKENINFARKAIKKDAELVKKYQTVAMGMQNPDVDKGEVIANVTLAYRHLEDASMRLGKALQALDGGESVYDKETTVGA